MGTSINASYSDQDYGYNFSKSVTGSGDLYNALRSMLPWTVPYDSNGDYIRNPNGDVNIINPIRELDYNTNQRRTFRWLPSHRNRLLKHHKFRLTMLAQYLPMKRRRCRK